MQAALRSVPPSGFKHGVGGTASVNVTRTDWSDIGGLDGVKRDLQSSLLWPGLYPGHYRALDLQRPSGVLLYGPPGCGKTSIVKAMAGTAGATFFYFTAFVSILVGFVDWEYEEYQYWVDANIAATVA